MLALLRSRKLRAQRCVTPQLAVLLHLMSTSKYCISRVFCNFVVEEMLCLLQQSSFDRFVHNCPCRAAHAVPPSAIKCPLVLTMQEQSRPPLFYLSRKRPVEFLLNHKHRTI